VSTLKTVTRSSKLGPEDREAAITALKEKELDILVVGGGIVGTGSALDAATRGLRVGMVEARDWASGTSSRSSKLVHGGIRYLEQLDFRLVREALKERGLLLQRLAPHLVKPVRFLYPLQKRVVERVYVGAGMLLYDIFSYTGGRPPGVPHHRHLSKRQVMRMAPSLANDALIGGITYYDAQVDDARYVSVLARTASFYGAHVASRVRVEGFIKVGQRVVGVHAHDLETGEKFDARSRSSTRRVCGRTTPRPWSASEASSKCAPRRVCTSSCRATASSPSSGCSSAPRRACCSSSPGAATG